MVGVNPVLRCLMYVEEGISRGDSIRDTLIVWIDRETAGRGANSRLHREFQNEILLFLRKTEVEAEKSTQFEMSRLNPKTQYRESLFTILFDGLNGHPVMPRLKELRGEIEAQLELDIKAHIESLPLKMLVPLLFAMFPAFLILLLGPITRNFVEALR